jgi:hypothetical protein
MSDVLRLLWPEVRKDTFRVLGEFMILPDRSVPAVWEDENGLEIVRGNVWVTQSSWVRIGDSVCFTNGPSYDTEGILSP